MTNKLGLIFTLAGFGLAGCFPVWKTIQPSARIFVKDTAGAPIQEATVILATAALPFGRTELKEFRTDKDGKVRIKRIRKWHVDIMLPDGWTQYVWNLCVSKTGFQSVPVPYPDFGHPIDVLLPASGAKSECLWSDVWAVGPQVVDGRTGQWIEVDGGDWNPDGQTMYTLIKELRAVAESDAQNLGRTLRPWSDYLFQYQGRMKENKPTVYIKALCEAPSDVDFRKVFYVQKDGASCFFELTYNASGGEFDGFQMRDDLS